MKKLTIALSAFIIAVALQDIRAAKPAPVLQPGDLVAVCGDSITEQKLYSLHIQQYLLFCQPAPGLMSMQFGWGGERAGGFVARVDNDVLPFKPTVATTCYGMNDGRYQRVNDETVAIYRSATTESVHKLKAGGVRAIIVGSPGVVDPAGFKRAGASADDYNKTLAALRDAARAVATAEGVLFADVHTPMMDAMTRAKAAHGEKYALARDGVHPGENGQLVMAYAFLKALGVSGDIGAYTVDYAAKRASATGGHRVINYSDGLLHVESTRYPFCFTGEPNGSGTLAMTAFIPFNDELNRLLLVVKNAPAKTRVTWGGTQKTFTAAQLASGVNLAAEFPQNPFCAPFFEATKKLQAQQRFETDAIKGPLNSLIKWRRDLPDAEPEYKAITQKLFSKMSAQREDSRAAVKPVRHQIKIEPAP
ncbi:SGNH/GDSL hydrolase family protein [Ereboglobus luteus]|uniref:SGNH hydrolase-type esterase domain-containing protein n=1 Tax=Ereboglobus luteus TaxID=1796921 RepID=A0A2U8E474_9BACT|nr:SGNH/GDSL hydrolase family protein [Ereboglobus luteus]AWI09344.1 hypothetical protein CKA38_08905 [Ereboglobus luteus]